MRSHEDVSNSSTTQREAVAILGGGMASLATAFALTDTAALRDRYAVTVYQDGWLLGGKGASVRNRAAHGRIEEHGLHVFLGYYENAFTLLARAYEELGRDASVPIRSLRDAFVKHSAIVVEEQTARGWEPWSVTFPETDEWPGEGRPLPSLIEVFGATLRQVLHYALAWWNEARRSRPDLRAAFEQLGQLLRGALAEGAAALAGKGARRLADGLRGLLERLREAQGPDLERRVDLRRLWTVLEFCGACLAAGLRADLYGPRPDVEPLDELDFRDLLRDNGASAATLESGLVRAFYHLAFCDGEGAGAGMAFLGMLRMFTCYRGAVFYKMRAGMGEVVFAPLYEVLRRRGVRFEFFHRVKRLELSRSRTRLERVVLDRQATAREGEYRPLITAGGLPCWPERPLYEQLARGEALAPFGPGLTSFWSEAPPVDERVLTRGVDFDHVVLGISLGALPFVAQELIAASPRWQRMVEHVKTVRTAALQLWTTEPIGALASSDRAPVVGAYEVPLETWADMSHLLPFEPEHARAGVAGVLYACGQLGRAADPIAASDPRAEGRADLERVARGFLEARLPHLWPRFTDERGAPRWGALWDAEGREGPARLEAQYLRVNAEPSDRYVLSVPGSQKHRIAPDDSGFEGLVLAGDWTRTGYDLGCIEAATMSGLMAARALGAEVAIVGEVPRRAAPPESSLPRYVDRPGEMALRAPYRMQDVWMTALVLRAQMDALEALLDRYLNEPSRGLLRYAPAAPFVILAAAFAGQAFSEDPEHRRFGTMPETDVAFWVPAFAMRRGPGGFLPERLVWFLPQVFVTTGAAAAAGREVYGFPKSVVEVEMRRSGRALDHLVVTGEVLARHTPETRGERARILEITRTGGGEAPAPRSFAEALGAITGPLGLPAALPGKLARGLAADAVTIAFLKQFRDVERTDRACYQAIVEADAVVRDLRGYGPLPGALRVAWDDHASHPFARELGLAPGGQEAVGALWVDFDFTMAAGREVFRAGR